MNEDLHKKIQSLPKAHLSHKQRTSIKRNIEQNTLYDSCEQQQSWFAQRVIHVTGIAAILTLVFLSFMIGVNVNRSGDIIPFDKFKMENIENLQLVHDGEETVIKEQKVITDLLTIISDHDLFFTELTEREHQKLLTKVMEDHAEKIHIILYQNKGQGNIQQYAFMISKNGEVVLETIHNGFSRKGYKAVGKHKNLYKRIVDF